MVVSIEIDPKDLSTYSLFNIMTGSIVPRPIAWISTVDRDGVRNLAPYSMFTAVCAKPPTVVVCPGHLGPDFHEKDTYRNVASTGEFVINFVDESLVNATDVTAAEFPAAVDEFAIANVTPIPSIRVAPPRVAESPISFECKLHEIVSIGLTDGGAHIVIGTVVYMHFDAGIYSPDNHINYDVYRPVGGLVGHSYAHVDEFFGV